MLSDNRNVAVQQIEDERRDVKKRLIIHIGMHKTGSSSVQRYFSRNRAVLRRMGLCYPRSIGAAGERQPKHAALFDAISHEADFNAPHPALGPSGALIEKIAAEIEAAPGRLAVLSAEGLSGERPVFAKALAPLGARFDATIVMFLRRQDHWVESFYKQMVLSRQVREARGFHEFVAAQSTREHMNYKQIADWWRDAFDDVRPFGFHAKGPMRPLARLLDVAKLGARYHWLPFAHAHANPSPGADAVEVVRRWNEAGTDAPRHAAQQIEAKLGASQGGYFTSEERIALLKTYQNGNQALLESLPRSDHSCLTPNMSEIGRCREMRWTGDISAQFLTNSNHLVRS